MKHLFPLRQLNASLVRQSVISNWLNQSVMKLGDVQLMAGHKYPSSTEKYLQPDSDEQRKLINPFHPLNAF
ncbi:MAG: integrase/recombinase XerD [Flavobacteriales bacterium]